MKSKNAYWIAGICFLGCTASKPDSKLVDSKGDTAAHSHAPHSSTNLPDSIKQLSLLEETISKAFKANTPDDAHDSLHEVGHLLESISTNVSGLADEKKNAVKKSVDELFACFGALDETLHGGPETPYSKVQERIATAMSALRSASQ